MLVRNDLGNDRFRILANIYNPEGMQVAHLELEEVFLVPAGETKTISFRWPQASGLGEHTIGIEFYSEDYESWNLKYNNAGKFFVGNRAAATAGVTDDAGTDSGTDSSSTAGAIDDAGTAGDSDGTNTQGSAGDGALDTGATAGGSGSGRGNSSSGCSVMSTNDPTFSLLLLGAMILLLRQGAQRLRKPRPAVVA